MNDFDSASSCLISTRVRHRVDSIMMRNDILVRVDSGVKTLLDRSGRLDFGSGSGLLMARGAQWDVINDPAPAGRYRARILLFGAAAIRDFDLRHAAEFPHAPLQSCAAVGVDAELGASVDNALAALGSPTSSARLRQHRVLEVLLLLAERGHVLKPADRISWDERARRLISQRPHAEWPAENLALALHVSVSTLRRRLADSGATIGELVREVRLETGLLLLQSTGLSVGEVAARCGYESHSRFSAAFRTRYGFAPSYLRSGGGRALNGAAHELTRAG